VSLSHGHDGWLRWILNDVHVSGKVIDNKGTIRWIVKDTVDSKTFDDIIHGDNDNSAALRMGNTAMDNIVALLEATAGLYVDQTMAGSLKFEVVVYEER
jgi:hypothetical protein